MATSPELPAEIVAEIATATVDAARLPRVVGEDNPLMSSAVRRRRTLGRTRRQVQVLEPLLQVGGVFGASVRRHPIWETTAKDQGWEFIGADTVKMDYADLALEFKQFSEECARHGFGMEPIKPM